MAEATSLGLPMATLACGHVNKKLGSRAAPHYNEDNIMMTIVQMFDRNGNLSKLYLSKLQNIELYHIRLNIPR